MLLEMLFSVLLAPVRMLFHTVFVVSAFLGWEVVWNSPQRDDDATPWSEAFRRHGSQMLLGLVWAVRDGVAGSALPVVAGADRLLADPVAVCLGDLQPCDGGAAEQTLESCS